MINSLYASLGQTPDQQALVLAAAAALQQQQLQQQQQQQQQQQDQQMPGSKDTTFTKIFVGGLPYHTTDATLDEYFRKFGEIEEAVVITDRQTQKSRGYGFVTMKDRAAAERACKDPNPIIDGRKANVNLAYLGAKPRGNAALASLAQLQLQGALPAATAAALYPGRLGLQQLYYPTAGGGGLITSPTALLSTTGSGAGGHGQGQFIDYAQLVGTSAMANYAAAAAAAASQTPAGATALYEQYAPAAAYGLIQSNAGYAAAPTTLNALQSAAAVAAAQQDGRIQ